MSISQEVDKIAAIAKSATAGEVQNAGKVIDSVAKTATGLEANVKADLSAFTAGGAKEIAIVKSGAAAFVAKWGIPALAFVAGLVLGHFARVG